MALPIGKIDLERIYTVEEYELLPEFGERYELIDGKLVKETVLKRDWERIEEDVAWADL